MFKPVHQYLRTPPRVLACGVLLVLSGCTCIGMAEVGVDQEVRNMVRSAERVEMIVGNFIVSLIESC